MSYLDLPRMHFSGFFFTDPSTINNFAENYDKFDPDDLFRRKWNPTGSHAWEFRGCAVTRLSYRDGTSTQAPGDDPMVGAVLQGISTPYPAKITSFDVQDQIVYELWGMEVETVARDTAGGFRGQFRLTQGVDGWQEAPMPPDLTSNNAFFIARFQSVLDELVWGDLRGSRFLEELRQLSPEQLSINVVADGYSNDPFDFTGRIHGTIGPALPFDGRPEPAHYVAGRLLRPRNYDPAKLFFGTPMFFAPAKVIDQPDRQVVVDLGSSLPIDQPRGQLTDLGDLGLALIRGTEADPQYEILGKISYPEYASDAFVQRAGIYEFPAPPDIEQQRLALVRLDDAGHPRDVLVEENPGAQYLIGEIPPQDDAFGHFLGEGMATRLNPGDEVDVQLLALAFGRPQAGVAVSLSQTTSFFANTTNASQPTVGVPQNALQIRSLEGAPLTEVVTDEHGRAAFVIRADEAGPGAPRFGGKLDGQIYGVAYAWAGVSPEVYNPNLWNQIHVRIFDKVGVPDAPKWADVQAIFRQYVELYPYMASIIPLDDYEAVAQPKVAQLIKKALSFPMMHPDHMPVTRDMSRDKRDLIIKWINDGAPRD